MGRAIASDSLSHSHGKSNGDNYGAKCTIEATKLAGNKIPYHYGNRYIVGVLKELLSEALASYDELISGGYDKKFNTYADAVVRSGTKVVERRTSRSRTSSTCQAALQPTSTAQTTDGTTTSPSRTATKEGAINPRQVVDKTYKALKSLGTDLDDVADTTSNGLYDANDDDLVDGIITPGTPSPGGGGKMAQIVDTADERAYQKCKGIMLTFLAVNYLLPHPHHRQDGGCRRVASRLAAPLSAADELALDIYGVVVAVRAEISIVVEGLEIDNPVDGASKVHPGPVRAPGVLGGLAH
ncbi:hypothetical protein QBC33DRAFT_562606 [Phialemonium atrogriseum]|uniref:Uncharacterized protein n=1 Tax=Phialemonium atrogriseum TaxID=1093897 RepID=A0AAJ0FK51_9PEZI|nr:uncharacterized protein QBC33DRAFT_562606 [Phialemonium atrogriseum]KAK1763740.1 hypothetical protein QBC33DRAFT_562606 [Phialemonium atrogriseum]